MVPMVVGSLEVHLRLEGCRSLKEKRHVLRPLIERLRRDLRASVAEVGDNDLWNVATVGVACVAQDRTLATQVLQRAMALIDECADVRVEGSVEDYC